MAELLHFEQHQIEVKRKRRQRNISLRIYPDGKIKLSCAVGISRWQLSEFVRENELFLKNSIKKVASFQQRYPQKKFESGEPFLIFGERIELQIIWSWSSRVKIQLLPTQIEMVAKVGASLDERRTALFKFLKARAVLELESDLKLWSQHMGLFPRKFSVRGQRTLWGSCSARGHIQLNWKLIAAPREVREYVVIHELAHLAHLNHSKVFWALVNKHCPDFESHKQWLRSHEDELRVQFQVPK